MYLRFLRAFRNKHLSYSECLSYELTEQTSDVCCCKIDAQSGRLLSNVALIVSKYAIKRSFDTDVYSLYRIDGSMYPTYARDGGYSESWAKPVYAGLVVTKSSLRSKKLREEIKNCIAISKQYGLKCYVIDDITLKIKPYIA